MPASVRRRRPGTVALQAIRVDHIFYPVTYPGSFESSDPLLNRIWETGAYTAHLCMQDGVWDASKRDRGRWMGDTDVSGRVIEDVFGDRALMEDTLDRLLGARPRRSARQRHPRLLLVLVHRRRGVLPPHRRPKTSSQRNTRACSQLLALVDAEFDERNLYANKTNVWLYVDWSPELNGDTPETRRATTLEFYRAYREAAWLLRELGDTANAEKYEQRAAAIKTARGGSTCSTPPPAPTARAGRPTPPPSSAAPPTPEQYAAIWEQRTLAGRHVRLPTGSSSRPTTTTTSSRAMAEIGPSPGGAATGSASTGAA